MPKPLNTKPLWAVVLVAAMCIAADQPLSDRFYDDVASRVLPGESYDNHWHAQRMLNAYNELMRAHWDGDHPRTFHEVSVEAISVGYMAGWHAAQREANRRAERERR